MRALNLKVLRDAAHLKGQLTAVATLVTCGVAVFVMLRSMHGYLRESQAAYYADYGFPEVFAHATRAPKTLERRLAAVPGVARVYVRIVRDVLLDVPGLVEPATGRLVSLPDDGLPPLNRLHVRHGSLPEPGRRDQALVSAAFAEANELRVGDSFLAILNGSRQRVTIVGTALSPEFIYEVSGVGSVFPDNRRFGAMWMSESAMAPAFEMEGGFNDVVATLSPGAVEREVLSEFDDLLEPFGGSGAYGRDLHLSHEFVTSEIEETTVTAAFFPALFLLVTAFLLHTTLLRLVRMEREQIGLMKAFGIPSNTVAVHYLKLGLLPVFAGIAAGIAIGIWLANGMAGVYARFYQFPEVAFHLDPGVVRTGTVIALVTGVTGSLAATRSVLRLAPAVAMAPPSPPAYRRGGLERLGLWRWLTPSGRIVARNILRSRARSLTTTTGIGLALGVVVALLSMFDSIDVIADLQFRHVYRGDVAVFFDSPRSPAATSEIAQLPGVLEIEPVRMAEARLVRGHRTRRTSLMGMEPEARLRQIVDGELRVHRPPPEGVLISRTLAERLEVRPGQDLRIEVTEGQRPVRDVVVTGIVDELIGEQVYMDARALDRLLGGPRAISGAWLRVDRGLETELYGRLKRLPGVAMVMSKDVMERGFHETIEESFMIALTSTVLLGVALIMAIVYNQARVALSERGRELASLRVLGFSRREVARMLLGEQGVLVLLAIPLGLLMGWGFTALMMWRFTTELFRMPVVADPGTYLEGVALLLAAGAAAALLVRRRLDRIDLIAVLKTRE